MLILAPLAVAQQTADEGAEIGVGVTVCRDGADVRRGSTSRTTIGCTDSTHRCSAVSCRRIELHRHHDAKTLRTLLDAFRIHHSNCAPLPRRHRTTGRSLARTPSFGICSRQEMLAEYFTHDGGETSVWRLKGTRGTCSGSG